MQGQPPCGTGLGYDVCGLGPGRHHVLWRVLIGEREIQRNTIRLSHMEQGVAPLSEGAGHD